MPLPTLSMLNGSTKTHINQPATCICTYINQALVLEFIMNVEVYVPFGDCVPLRKVLVVSFPEGMRRRGTGTGGMVLV